MFCVEHYQGGVEKHYIIIHMLSLWPFSKYYLPLAASSSLCQYFINLGVGKYNNYINLNLVQYFFIHY